MIDLQRTKWSLKGLQTLATDAFAVRIFINSRYWSDNQGLGSRPGHRTREIQQQGCRCLKKSFSRETEDFSRSRLPVFV